MNTTVTSRRRFLTGIASAIAAGPLLKASPARSDPNLDATFCRSTPPYLCVDYPTGWSLTERLLTDLIDPIQLLHLSSGHIDPHDSRDSGFPNVGLLQRDSALLSVLASRYDPETGVEFRDGSEGIGGWNLDSVHDEGSDVASLMAWYRLDTVVYQLNIWTAPSFDDWATLQAIVESLRISRQ